MCMADSFCFTVETNTTLLSNDAPVKINFKNSNYIGKLLANKAHVTEVLVKECLIWGHL